MAPRVKLYRPRDKEKKKIGAVEMGSRKTFP